MKITACCITWNRPRELERLIECFTRQTHKDRELLILDDAGQYPDEPSGDRWQVISINKRFDCIGAKRNALAFMTGDTDSLAVWDTDDIYLPWALESSVNALEKSPWAQCHEVLEWSTPYSWTRHETFSRAHRKVLGYHGSWSYRKSAFIDVGGYPATGQEDNPLRVKMIERFGMSANPICKDYPDPWYVYSRGASHISTLYANAKSFQAAWDQMGAEEVTQETLTPGWDQDYLAIDMPTRLRCRPW